MSNGGATTNLERTETVYETVEESANVQIKGKLSYDWKLRLRFRIGQVGQVAFLTGKKYTTYNYH